MLFRLSLVAAFIFDTSVTINYNAVIVKKQCPLSTRLNWKRLQDSVKILINMRLKCQYPSEEDYQLSFTLPTRRRDDFHHTSRIYVDGFEPKIYPF